MISKETLRISGHRVENTGCHNCDAYLICARRFGNTKWCSVWNPDFLNSVYMIEDNE